MPGVEEHGPEATSKRSSILAGLTALGVVYGDLGTSPLYAMRTIVEATGSHLHPETAMGILSLVIWSLVLVISIKYCLIVLRADNRGEGGILALMSLVGVDDWRRGAYAGAAMGVFGAALIYGDGVITPAISVLSALEGLNVATDVFKPYVLPAALVVLAVLFAVQRYGTARIGRAFGPIMLAWFVVIGVLGFIGVLHHPGVLAAVDPVYAFEFLYREHGLALAILGGVFLCCTGGEALYADMGPVGRGPVRLAWYAVVLPSLLLSYAGQTAVLVDGLPAGKNPFFLLAPDWARYPLVALATVATIIASQAIITGSFSMTRQAIQLGWLPRIRIMQTSQEAFGQVYIPQVNWLMAAATIVIALLFRTSDRLAGAYGMAVATTMLITTLLLYRAMRDVWRWPRTAVLALTGLFLVVDLAFFSANLLKLPEGGYVPLCLAIVIFTVMLTWRVGVQHVDRKVSKSEQPLGTFLAMLDAQAIPRTPGTGIFLTRPGNRVPAIVVDYVRSVGALKAQVVALSVTVAAVPRVSVADRVRCVAQDGGFWRVDLHCGFMQAADVPRALKEVDCFGELVDLDAAIYFAQRDFVLRSDKRPGMAAWRTKLFAFLYRNGARMPDRFDLPPDRTVEIARQIEI